MSRVLDWIVSVRATRRIWQALLISLDVAVVVVGTLLAYYARFEGSVPESFARAMPWLTLVACLVYIAIFAALGLYRIVLRYVGVDTALRLVAAVGLGFSVLVVVDMLLPLRAEMRPVPFGVLFIQALLVLLGAASVRLAVRVVMLLRGRQGAQARRVLIVGGGSAGSLLLRELQQRPDLGLSVVGFLDDDPELAGRTIGGVRVVGTTSDLASAVEKRDVEEIIVAMPSAPPEDVRRILNAAADAGVSTRITPALVIGRGAVRLTDLRKVEVEDLLGREQTPIDVEEIAETIAGRVVAVTGAAGSIGSELCRQVLKLGPSRLVLIEIDETRLYELWLELESVAPQIPVMCLCDIRDAASLERVFAVYRPQLVLHAAAYKHVPLMELAPEEAFKTNVLGTRNLVEVCERNGVERFVLISTDKAVAPANFMGLTKALAERVMLSASQRGLCAVAVRFGNVLASRGSVVPIFEEQLRHGGPLTVTDPEVTRYFMTIPEAARLVLQAQAIGSRGDLFVLEMGDQVRIGDLARKMIALSGAPADIEYTGLRPGEKLHEDLVHEHESLVPTGRQKILRVDAAVVLPDDFEEDIANLIRAAERGDRRQMMAFAEALDPHFADRHREQR